MRPGETRKMQRRRLTTDKKVIAAFLDKKAASSKKLETDGRRLDGSWMGGRGIAEWTNGRIALPDLGSRAAQKYQRAIRRAVPKKWILAEYELSPKERWVAKVPKKGEHIGVPAGAGVVTGIDYTVEPPHVTIRYTEPKAMVGVQDTIPLEAITRRKNPGHSNPGNPGRRQINPIEWYVYATKLEDGKLTDPIVWQNVYAEKSKKDAIVQARQWDRRMAKLWKSEGVGTSIIRGRYYDWGLKTFRQPPGQVITPIQKPPVVAPVRSGGWSVSVGTHEFFYNGKALPYSFTVGQITDKGKVQVWTPAASKHRGYPSAAKAFLERIASELKAQGKLAPPKPPRKKDVVYRVVNASGRDLGIFATETEAIAFARKWTAEYVAPSFIQRYDKARRIALESPKSIARPGNPGHSNPGNPDRRTKFDRVRHHTRKAWEHLNKAHDLHDGRQFRELIGKTVDKLQEAEYYIPRGA